MSYSVIIPTMGRETLDAAIESVLSQSLPAHEIIIVAGAPPRISDKNLSKVILVENFLANNKVWTAAHNRNVGITISKSDFVAFLDDDDLWKKEKMQIQIDFLLKNPGYVCLSSAIYKVRKWFFYKRPIKVLKNNQDILKAHYGKKRYFPIPYYTPTPGIVVPSKIAKDNLFDETLPGFEDTWWLHQIQAAGFRLFQHKDALVKINANPVRSISRDSLMKNVAWAVKLSSVDQILATNYLEGICRRNALIGRRWSDLKFYSKSLDVLKREF